MKKYTCEICGKDRLKGYCDECGQLLTDIDTADGDSLVARHEEIIGVLTAGKGTAIDNLLTELLEIEREMTLREG